MGQKVNPNGFRLGINKTWEAIQTAHVAVLLVDITKGSGDYEEFILIKENGYFWEKYLDGNQYNYDMVIENGRIIDSFCYHSVPLNDGTFLYHQYIKKNIPSNIVKLIPDLTEISTRECCPSEKFNIHKSAI